MPGWFGVDSRGRHVCRQGAELLTRGTAFPESGNETTLFTPAQSSAPAEVTIDMDRRTFVRGVGTVTVAGALAGCGGGGGGGDDGGDDTGDGGGDDTGGSDGDGDDTGGSDGDGGGDNTDVPDDVDSYLQDNSANLYDGSAVDMTGEDEVEISVGAGDNGFAFDPPAVRLDSGTTVVWVWTGQGGGHNVVAQDGADFNSGDPVSDAGATYEFTPESSGNITYYCNPHRGAGMHGALIVE